MKVGIIQSNFIPWRGYFDFIDEVDLFIYYDDMQFTKNDWRNRNLIKTMKGTAWVTVPVIYDKLNKLICDTEIDYSRDWISKAIGTIHNNYHKASYYKLYANNLFTLFKSRFRTISELNININNWIIKILGIETKIRMSHEFKPVGRKTDRIIDILTKAGADTYLSGPSAKKYLEKEKFLKSGIKLEYKSYDYLEYRQLFNNYEPNVTILDLIFNTGINNREYWKSLTPNIMEPL